MIFFPLNKKFREIMHGFCPIASFQPDLSSGFGVVASWTSTMIYELGTLFQRRPVKL